MVTDSRKNINKSKRKTLMNTFDTYKNLPQDVRNMVIAIGNFDGVHQGHCALLDHARRIADEKGLKLGVLTFEPHPRKLFQPDEPPARLSPPPVKLWRLEELGVDAVFSLPFDWDFASQSYEEFIETILKDGLGAEHVVVGADFRFGQLRKGAPHHIQEAGVEATVFEKVGDESGAVFSSSRTREFIRHGRIEDANVILGWDWEIRGVVVCGDQRGRELGYPTANMELGETVHPAYGIYAAMVQVQGEDEWHKAAVNIGIRPMFEVSVAQVESHILDFDRDIYGEILRVRPVKRLRGEAKFDSLEDLTRQMAKDCEMARSVLEEMSS